MKPPLGSTPGGCVSRARTSTGVSGSRPSPAGPTGPPHHSTSMPPPGSPPTRSIACALVQRRLQLAAVTRCPRPSYARARHDAQPPSQCGWLDAAGSGSRGPVHARCRFSANRRSIACCFAARRDHREAGRAADLNPEERGSDQGDVHDPRAHSSSKRPASEEGINSAGVEWTGKGDGGRRERQLRIHRVARRHVPSHRRKARIHRSRVWAEARVRTW